MRADRQAVFSVFPVLEYEMHLNAVQLGLASARRLRLLTGSSRHWQDSLWIEFAAELPSLLVCKSGA